MNRIACIKEEFEKTKTTEFTDIERLTSDIIKDVLNTQRFGRSKRIIIDIKSMDSEIQEPVSIYTIIVKSM